MNSLEEVIEKSLSEFDAYYAKRNLKSSKIITIKDNRDNIVGFTELKVYKPVGIIFYIGVLPAYRGRGYGKRLLEEAEAYFMSKGLDYILASTRRYNKQALGLFRRYKRFDIDSVSDDVIYLLDAYDDDIILCREINGAKVPCEVLIKDLKIR
ncbi:MAG: GNAT family N-acetyltransferase [Sulfolobaceae archaeon]|nr:GNAT family N-acetyltransferase [Sulfolobaceae archaeon]